MFYLHVCRVPCLCLVPIKARRGSGILGLEVQTTIGIHQEQAVLLVLSHLSRPVSTVVVPSFLEKWLLSFHAMR